MRYLDQTTYATNPGNIILSEKKVKYLNKSLFGIRGIRNTIMNGRNELAELKEHLLYGDSQPAVVISVNPLVVAAYSEDLDCVALLKFKNNLVEQYQLKEQTRLITINTYMRGRSYQKDLTPGPKRELNWVGFYPVIGEFVTENMDVLEKKKQAISEELWNYVYHLGKVYMMYHPKTYRNGIPPKSQISAI